MNEKTTRNLHIVIPGALSGGSYFTWYDVERLNEVEAIEESQQEQPSREPSRWAENAIRLPRRLRDIVLQPLQRNAS